MNHKWTILILMLFLGVSFASLAQRGDSSTPYSEAGQMDRLVNLYPNPATEYLLVKLPVPHANTVKLALHSVIGNAITIEKEPVDEYEVRIWVGDLPSGYYFLSVKDEESDLKASYKFLKR